MISSSNQRSTGFDAVTLDEIENKIAELNQLKKVYKNKQYSCFKFNVSVVSAVALAILIPLILIDQYANKLFWGQYEVKPQPATFCENAIAKNLKGAKICAGLKEIDRGLFPQLKALPDVRGLVHVLPQVFSSIFVISVVLAVIAKNFFSFIDHNKKMINSYNETNKELALKEEQLKELMKI